MRGILPTQGRRVPRGTVILGAMEKMKEYALVFAGDVRQSFLDLTVIVVVVSVFQFLVVRSVPDEWPSMLLGLVVVGVGLALFMRGLEVGIFPLGAELAELLSASSSRLVILLFGFVIGFATTVAEPALIAVVGKAASVSGGVIDALTVRIVVALAVGSAIVLAIVRLFFGHPIHYYIIAGYVMAVALSFFAPPEIVGLAFDSGGVTTSTVTVPLIAALGIGLARAIPGRNPIIDGFGFIAFASVTPMIFVQLYGILAYNFGFAIPSLAFFDAADSLSVSGPLLASAALTAPLGGIVLGLLKTVIDILPIIVVIVFFYYAVLRKPIANIPARGFGVLLVILGLYAFVFGLEQGLFPIGESLARSLAEKGVTSLVYLFAFAIGFATTMAEPALTAVARKAEEVSGGAIRQRLLRIFVAVGAGFGIFLGAYRIVHGDPILNYLLAGYALVITLTTLAPRSIIPVAYDSGGVTTSTITVPIVAALGIGLASTIPGRDPLADGFGMIALTVLFPIISVLSYGIVERAAIRRYEKRLKDLGSQTVDRILRRLQEEDTEVVQRTKKEIITVTGKPGSGVSTVARLLAERLRYQYFSAGDIFRATAERHHASVADLRRHAEEDPSIDREIDELVQELGIKHTRLVVDSRLAYHWVHRSFKVFLEVSYETGARRHCYARSAKGEETSFEETLHAMQENEESKKRRYRDLYGLDIEHTGPFTLVVNTEVKSPEEVAEEIIAAYTAWLGKVK